MKRSVAVIFLIVIETLRKNSAFDASDSTYSDLSGDLNVLPKVYCTKNERECQELQTCQPFKPYMCLEDPGCGQWCYSVECNPNPCPHGQSCVNIWYLDDLEQPVDRCYCPPGLVPAVNGTCVEAPSKCSAALKDRYCDNDCKLGPNSTVTCTCPSGLTLEHRKLGKFEFVEYGVCIPADDDEFGARKVVINGEENSELMPDDGYITLNSPTAVDRVQIRPTKESIQQIYAVTKDQLGRFQLSLFSSNGHRLNEDYLILYSLEITDFAMDWPTGNVYYTSTCEPHLTVCNIDGTACRILPASTLLEDPKEMLIDSDLGYLLVSDAKKIWKISLNGSKTQSLELVSGAKRLALDHHNKYLYYLLIRDRSVYRINYQIFDKIPQKLMWLQNAKSIGEITSMTSIGRELYMAEYKAENNTSYLYHLNSSNPFYMGNLTMLLRLPGRLKDVLVYHKSLVNIGPTLTTSTMNCHLVLQGSCTCMEGYELNKEGRCVQVDIRISKKDVLLYNSQSRRLVQGIFASDTMRCPSSALTTIPINPVTLPDYVTSNSDVHIGYDPVDNMLYISDEVTISNASAAGTGYVARLTDTGWRARGGTIIYGLAINPSVRTLFYAEYSRIHYNIIAVSLDNREIRASYISSPTIGHRYFSTGLSLDRSSFEFRIFDLQNSLSTPIIHGVSMLHARSIDPKTGDFFDIGFGEKTTLGYSYLPPGANSSMARVNVDIGHPLNALSMGNHSILHFSSTMKRYGMVNTSNPSQVMLCDTFKLSISYIRTNSRVPPKPVQCINCSALCLQNPLGNFSCVCDDQSRDSSCQSGNLAICERDQFVCPGTSICLERTKLCDGVEDCEGQEDEQFYTYCPVEEVTCSDSYVQCNETKSELECIRKDSVCDGVPDCSNGEDEEHCDSSCSFFTCPMSGICYGLRLCDGVSDCPEYSTEHDVCSSCHPTAYKCPTTKSCISKIALCDGISDCPDGADEQNCTGHMSAGSCGVDEKTCDSGQCIPEIWWCDQTHDCIDRSDESSCETVTCSDGFVKCNNTGHCIPLSWRCDMHRDCLDGEDESNCEHHCPDSEYYCAGTETDLCISKSQLCNSLSDCDNGMDESLHCDSEACDSALCSHECVVDPVTGDAMCLCPRGMELANNTCIEIRRACGQWGVCSQECTSLLDDRFKCTCHEDYLIESDLYSCTHKERPVSLIFSNRHELRLLSAEPGTLYSTLISSLRNTIALDYHWEKHYVFWSDVITDKIYRGTREPDSSSNSLVDIRVVVTNGLPTAEGLAVDWIGDHIYWVESGLDIIEVADLEGNNRATIITHSDTNPMENPRSIAVDPRVGLLFWADWGIRQIRRASMAGKDAKMLFLVNDPNYIPDGGWANGLTLDYDTRRVYWNDAKSDSIQTVDYNGEHFHLVLEKNDLLMHPFAISVFENWVYWSDWRRNSINRANKWNGTSAEIVQSTVTQPFDLKVYHVGRQPPVHVDSANMCGIDNGNCSHLCLSDGLKAHCACPHLLKLALDKRTCQEINSFLLLASSRLLTSISLSSDDYGVIPTLAAPIVDSVYIADYYMVDGDDEQRLFWADSGLNTISTATIDGSNPTNIIHLPIAVEYGFAVDYIYKRLYITTFSLRTSSSPGGIDVCAFDGSRRVTITSSLVMPTRISLQPSNGTMFVIDEGTGAIYHMYMNGSHLSANGTRNNILEGSSYRFDNIRDMNLVLSSDNHLRSRLYFGNRTHIFCYDGRRISLLTDKLVERWTVWEDDLYFTVAFDNQSLPSGYDIKKIALSAPLSSARKVGAVKGQLPLFMRLVEAHMTASGEERVKCLDCNHYCLPPVDPSTDYGTCVCYASYRYENSSCRAISPMLLYATRDHGLGAVELSSQGWAVNSANVLPVISQVNRPNALYYYSSCTQPGSDYIYWIDSGHSIVRSNRDLTERKTIVSGLIAAKDLAIDPQGGNMYWIDSFTGTVQVCQTDGAHCLILAQLDKEGDNQLVSLALHVSKGYLFYLESARGITKMRLGNNRTAEFIGSSPLIGASAMAVDIVGDRLFVCDGLHQITSMDLDGSHRTAYSISLDNKNCSSIAVQGGFVYYVLHRYTHGEILMKNVLSAAHPVSIANVTGYVNDIALAWEGSCTESGVNPCAADNGGCGGLCLFNGNQTSESHCVCAIGVLDSTKKKCEDLLDFLIYSKIDAIEFHNVMGSESSLSYPYPPISSNKTVNVIALAIDVDRQRIYYSDIERGTITWVSYNGTLTEDILESTDSVQGLAYANDHLYLTYQPYRGVGAPAIKYVDLSVSPVVEGILVELDVLDAPRAIAIHACSGLVFWTNWNDANPSIQRAETTGANFVSIVTENIVIPNGLTIDQKMEKIFWADANLDKIEMCDFFGLECTVVLEDASPHIFAMAIHGDYLYWTDWLERSVKMAHKLYGFFNQTLIAKPPRQPMGIAIASRTTCKVSPCYNSVCEQTCSVIGNAEGHACGCFNGYIVDPDKAGSCKPVKGCLENTAFACQGDCIPWELTCDGVNHCPPDSNSVSADEEPLFCVSRKCPDDRYFTCLNQRCIALSSHCNGYDDCGDLSDEFNCHNSCDPTTQFKCDDNSCIPLQELCDGVPHCWDKSDELPPHCNTTQTAVIDCSQFNNPFYGYFKNGTKCANTPVCIIDEWKCDGHNDCWDNSDEVDCDKSNDCIGTDEWACSGTESQVNHPRQCIIKIWRCDGDLDCNDGSDEVGCENSVVCPDGAFACDNSMCIPMSWKCDGRPDCSDSSDENGCSTLKPQQCDNSEFACLDGKSCINPLLVCDGENDCLDESDERPELNCLLPNCTNEEHMCDNGQCIFQSFVCDRTKDCLDGSDEAASCPYEVCDPVTEFTCADKSCIALADHCNAWPDCPDGSDEAASTCAKAANSSCPRGQWRCPLGTCINESKLCDGNSDCDFADELACNLNECEEQNGGCNQHCIDEKVYFHCGCYDGYKLQSDNRTCLDINECETSNPCSQRCLNTPGRYLCSCAPGFTLREDKKSCKPVKGDPAYLLVANRYYIRNISLRIDPVTNEASQILLSRDLANAVGLDYHWKERMVYWTDVTIDVHNISRMYMNGTGKEVLHSVTLKHPDGLAVDWIGENLYWSDSILNTIQVSKLNGASRKVLLYGISEPRSLQVLPSRGYLFYTDWGQDAHVGRVGMDGSGHTRIITDGIGWPNALAIDPFSEKLFFGDAKLDYVAVTDLNGDNKRIVINKGLDHIFSLAVFDGTLYWSDWGSRQIHRVHIYMDNPIENLTTLIHRPMGVRIVHELIQTYKGSNPCDELRCSNLCLLKPRENSNSLEAVCACPEFFYLHTDNRTCHSNCTDISRFQCREDTQCLHFTQLCDGHQDCTDGSDEDECDSVTSPCSPYQFNCNSISSNETAVCVDADLLCDGKEQCPHGEDEKIYGNCKHYSCLSDLYYQCYNKSNYVCFTSDQICLHKLAYTCPAFDISLCEKGRCKQTEFQCNGTGTCIPYVYHCDGENDCVDGSDESNATCSANLKCAPNYVRCNHSGQCIPESWMCDGDKDCLNGQDENATNCVDSSCPKGYWQCPDRKCIPVHWLCDYESDCIDGGDELNCQHRKCSESETACDDGRCFLSRKRCDGYSDCSDGSDEKGCGRNRTCDAGYFGCANSAQCIPMSWKCDGTSDCEDLSDEIACAGRVCRWNEFQCDNSICISSAFKCDGQNDCLDKSDESDSLCSMNKCLTDRFRCGNSKCVSASMLCDDKDDCGDRSDEDPKNCMSKCGHGFYRCPNGGGCISAEKVCDGNVDCPSFTKEARKGCTNIGCPFETDEWNSECIARKEVGGCAHIHASIFYTKVLEQGKSINKRCSPKIKCENITSSLVNITCEKGYEVDVAHAMDPCKLCKDKDECVEYGSCSQLCSNLEEGYSCSCAPGFVQVVSEHLGPQHDCVLASDENPYLILADGYVIRSYEMARDSNDRPSFLSYSDSISRIDSVAVDLTGKQWSAYLLSYHSKAILQADITSLKRVAGKTSRLSKRQSSTAVKPQSISQFRQLWGNLNDPKSLTFDWVHGNLYWVDSLNRTISLLDVKQSLQATVVTSQSMFVELNDGHLNPQYITIDPTFSMRIFWTDCCVKPRIWSADLDGGSPKMLTDRLEGPAGITCDVANQRLYWTDSKRGSLSTMTVDGDDLRLVHTFTDLSPSMIDVFGRELIVTSLNRSTVVTMDKFMGLSDRAHNLSVSTIVSSQSTHVSDALVIHPAKQLLPQNASVCLCGNNTIVTETFHEGYKRCSCLCADDYKRINESDCSYCPCMNKGTCSNPPQHPVTCVCPQGYGGQRCEQHLCKDYCNKDAQCDVFDGKPYCLCPSHLSGERCEFSKCKGFACENYGTCQVDDGGLPYCLCPSSYTGERCERKVLDPCKEICWKRSSSCTILSNSYSCNCLPQYTGGDCETCNLRNGSEVYECHRRGKCVYDEKHQPKCLCTVGHFDSHSQCLHSICKDRCLNGGTCSVGNKKETVCSCPPHFTGERCELRMTCVTGYCENGGTCLESDKQRKKPAQCLCLPQYAGSTCESYCGSCTGKRFCQLVSGKPRCGCPQSQQGDDCQYSAHCNNYCGNNSLCLGCTDDSQSCDSCCTCRCKDGSSGTTCGTSNTSSTQSPLSSHTGTIIAGAICGLIILTIFLFGAILVFRKRQRRRYMFEHLRLSEDRDHTMHVSNPMYMKSVQDDIDEPDYDADDDQYSVYSATNTSNFANPSYNEKNKRKRASERKLLINDNKDE